MTSKHDPLSLVPYGFVVTRSWLIEQGIGRHTVDNWLKSGQIVAVARGVFRRPDVNKLTWQGVVCSLQRVGSDLTPGGLTALTLLGMAHYLSPTAHKTVHLYGMDTLPTWANKLLPDTHFIRHSGKRLFGALGAKGNVYAMKKDTGAKNDHVSEFSTAFVGGTEEWPLTISTPERAILEVLLEVPERVSFEHAEQLLQGLPTLSPHRLSELLECCTNVKVKRLFLWLAEKSKSPWLKSIDSKKFGMGSGALGSGKRVIAKRGKLDSKYLITVPRAASEGTYE
jgi:hypothetical protein